MRRRAGKLASERIHEQLSQSGGKRKTENNSSRSAPTLSRKNNEQKKTNKAAMRRPKSAPADRKARAASSSSERGSRRQSSTAGFVDDRPSYDSSVHSMMLRSNTSVTSRVRLRAATGQYELVPTTPGRGRSQREQPLAGTSSQFESIATGAGTSRGSGTRMATVSTTAAKILKKAVPKRKAERSNNMDKRTFAKKRVRIERVDTDIELELQNRSRGKSPPRSRSQDGGTSSGRGGRKRTSTSGSGYNLRKKSNISYPP